MKSPRKAFAFALDAKTEASLERIHFDTGQDQSVSDNGDDVPLAGSFAPAPSATLACRFCARRLWLAFAGQTFCDHACYSASLRRPIGPRFWAKVNQHGPVHPVLGTHCWPWTGAQTGGSSVRQGQVTWRARYRTPQKAHRIAWELTAGPIPVDRQINHHCDNPICCNPAHLYLGSQADNMRDASVRRRFSVPHTYKLSLFQRLTIYQTPAYRGIGVDLARRYGVTAAAICSIRRGRFLGSGVWAGTAGGS